MGYLNYDTYNALVNELVVKDRILVRRPHGGSLETRVIARKSFYHKDQYSIRFKGGIYPVLGMNVQDHGEFKTYVFYVLEV